MARIDPEALLRAERVFSTKELAELAQQVGWSHDRTKGSHQIFSRVGWPDNLSIPVHREYEWGVAKGILYKILAPLRDQVPTLPTMVETVERALSNLLEQADRRIHDYETQKMEEVDLLFQGPSENASATTQPPGNEQPDYPSLVQDLTLRLEKMEQTLCANAEQQENQRSDYESILQQQRIESTQTINALTGQVKTLGAESHQFREQIDQLRHARDRMTRQRRRERALAGVILGVFSVLLGTALLRSPCNLFPQTPSIESQRTP